MPITPSANYLAKLRQGTNAPNVVLEVALDSGTQKWGFAKDTLAYALQTYDIKPILGSVSSLQNKLDPKNGFATRGQITVVISGRDFIKNLIATEHLKNRGVTYKHGFLGLAYADYCSPYRGKILDWSYKGGKLTLVIADLMWDTAKKVPVENATKTQSIDYRNKHPMDIMDDLLTTQCGIAAADVDSAILSSEGMNWLPGLKFDRVLTEPKEAKEFLNELQIETNSFLFDDGEKITCKVFAPPVPGQTIEEYTERNMGEPSVKSGYKDNFFNRVVIYLDYDESGSDKEENFEAAVIVADAASQSASEWDEVATKTIKSKWLRTRTYTQPANVTGVVLYHVSLNNGTGAGTLTYDNAADTLTWTPPGGTVGEAVKVTKDGKYQIFGSDKTKWVRAVVTYASLPASNQNDTITLTALSAESYARSLAKKLLSRYRNPSVTVTFTVGLNSLAWNGKFRRPTDLVDITTEEAFEYGESGWDKERCMITSMRPDWSKGEIEIEAIEAKMYRKYGFISPASHTADWDSASAAQKEYAFVGDTNNQLGAANTDGFYIQ